MLHQFTRFFISINFYQFLMAQLALARQGQGHKVNILWNVQKCNSSIIGMNYVDTNVNHYRCIMNNTELRCNYKI